MFRLLHLLRLTEYGTNKVVKDGLSALTCMEHRGGCGGDSVSGDGAGVMTEIPWKIFKDFTSESCPRPGVGQVFMPRDETRRNAVKAVMEKVATENGLIWLGWREAPTDPDVLGPLARASMPSVWQFFVKPSEDFDDEDEKARDAFERTLYFVRRRFAVELAKQGLEWDDDDGVVYLPSFSSRTIVFKGMVQSEVLSLFFLDLQNPDYTSKFMIYHRRFSTNTTPKWPLAQPMRTVGHNGEINTLLGNVNWVRAREKSKTIEAGDITDDGSENIVTMCEKQDIPSLLESVVSLERSDSANLDGVFELMCQSDHSAPCALMAMVPTAYMENPDLKDNPEITDFYKFHGGKLEAWDGPALLVYSDGKSIGASLDRNGLRPARFSRTKDGTTYMMSETGVIPNLDEATIVEKGRLGPGQMVNIDLTTGTFKDNIAIKSEIAKRKSTTNCHATMYCFLCERMGTNTMFYTICMFSQIILTVNGWRSRERMFRKHQLIPNACMTTKLPLSPNNLLDGVSKILVCKFRTWLVLEKKPRTPWEMMPRLLYSLNARTQFTITSNSVLLK